MSVAPEGLAPELLPLAWLVGSWRGPGILAYPGVPEQAFVQEATFGHDGGPYLAYTSTIRVLGGASGDGDGGAAGPVWSAESGYWRVVPPAARPGGGTRTDLEVLIAEPTGHVSVYLGAAEGPRLEIATDLVARTATAADVAAVHRMYGLVGGELMWAMDLAAFGHELQSYASARLTRTPAGGEGG